MSDLPPSLVIDGLDIEWNGQKCDAIELREPKMHEMRTAYHELKNDDAESMANFQIALVCAVSGKPKQIIERMSVSKMHEAFEYVSGFMNPGPTTGEN